MTYTLESIERRLRKIARLNTLAEVMIMRWQRFTMGERYRSIVARMEYANANRLNRR